MVAAPSAAAAAIANTVLRMQFLLWTAHTRPSELKRPFGWIVAVPLRSAIKIPWPETARQ
jgi:hypothetical protein